MPVEDIYQVVKPTVGYEVGKQYPRSRFQAPEYLLRKGNIRPTGQKEEVDGPEGMTAELVSGPDYHDAIADLDERLGRVEKAKPTKSDTVLAELLDRMNKAEQRLDGIEDKTTAPGGSPGIPQPGDGSK